MDLTWPLVFTSVRYGSERWSPRCKLTSLTFSFGAVLGLSDSPSTKPNRTMSEYREKGK